MRRLIIGGGLLGAALLFAVMPLYAVQAQKPEARAKAADSASVINLNTATVAQLETLPGIGRKTAERILEYRQKNGAFKKIEELMNVRGVGEKSFLKLKPFITVTPAKAERTGSL